MTTLIVEDHIGSGDMPDSRPAVELEAAPTSICEDPLFSFAGRVGGIVVTPGGSLLVSDMASGVIWRVDESGASRPLVVTSFDTTDGWEQPLHLFTPAGLALTADGTLVFADSSRHRICSLSSNGTLGVLAGGANGFRDGPARQAMFRFPLDVAIGPDGTCYVADTVNDRIRAISPQGEVHTVAGSIYDYGDGRGAHARFRRPAALDVDREGNIYVADTGNNAIRRVNPEGEVTTLAGMPPGGDRDGTGREVGLHWPSGIALDRDGTVWVADHGNGAVRRISSGGESTTELRLAGWRWPTVLAAGHHGTLVVAGLALADVEAPRAWVSVLRRGS